MSGLRVLAERPFFVALLIQIVVLLIQLLATLLAGHVGMHLMWNPLRLVLVQSVLSTFLSRWLNQPIWWWWIHAAFPPAVGLALYAGLPSWTYLLALLMLLPWYWHTFTTRVPYFPSSLPVWRAVADLLPEGECQVLELGSGLGGFSLWLSRWRPECRVIGVEWAPMPWLISRIRAGRRVAAPIFLRQDYRQMDWQPYDLVFAYLSPAAMPEVLAMARQRMRPGSLLVSYEFDVPDVPADKTIRMSGMRAQLYAWYI